MRACGKRNSREAEREWVGATKAILTKRTKKEQTRSMSVPVEKQYERSSGESAMDPKLPRETPKSFLR